MSGETIAEYVERRGITCEVVRDRGAQVEDGWEHHAYVVAEVCGVTRARVSQLVAAARDSAWGAPFVGAAVPVTHASVAAEMRLAQHAQDLRCESATGLNRAEVRAFYGHADESTADVVEARLTIAAARREHRARLAHERELAAAYRARVTR